MVKTIDITVFSNGGVSPDSIIDAGVQGDDKTTALNVTVDSEFIPEMSADETLKVYAECVNGAGEYYVSDFLDFTDNTINFPLPIEITRGGGMASLHFVFSVLNASNVQQCAIICRQIKLKFEDSAQFYQSEYLDTMAEALANVYKYRGQIEQTQTDIDNLRSQINRLDSNTLDAVERLSADDDKLQAQIDTANTDISALKTTDEDLQAQINSMSSVDMSQVQQQLEVLGDASKITRTYNNMTVAVGAGLRKGEVFQTLGFSKVGDGGAGVYYITDTTWGDDNNPCYLPYGEGLYARYIYKQKANVMALGAKNDNSTDCSDIINRFFNSEGTVNHTLYFPKGTYRCENPISYAPKTASGTTNTSRHINIEGCRPSRSARAYMYTSDGVQKPTVTSLSILYFPIADKTEGFTAIDLDCTYAHIKNIHILSDSGEFEILENDGKKWDYRPVDEDGNPLPYNPLQYTAKLENVNGIDGSKLTRFCLDGVGITGFSGYGTTCNKQCDFKDVYVQACGVGIKQTSSDAMLYDCYVTGCNVGIQCSDGVLFAYNIFIDQIVTHAIKGTEIGQTSLNISGCIDHIGYSAIYLNRSYDNKVDVRMGRCGMYYGGVALENIPNNFEELSKASNISIQNLSHGTFHLSTYLRDITDDDNDICALPVYLLNGGTWRNASVFGTYPDEYQMLTPIMSGDSNISVYTSSGHYATYNVGDTVGLVNINDKITDLTARIEALENSASS